MPLSSEQMTSGWLVAASPNGQWVVSSRWPCTSGIDREAEPGHGPGDGLNRPVVAGLIGDSDLGGQLGPVGTPDRFGHLTDILRRNLVEHPDQHLDEHLEPAWGEMDRDLLGGRLVALGRATGPGPTLAGWSTMADLQIALVGEKVEMVTGDIGVDARTARRRRKW